MIQIVSGTTLRTILGTNISNQIKDEQLTDTCLMIQETLGRDTLGQELYEEIYGQYTGTTLTTTNSYLKTNFIDYIVSYGVWLQLVVGLSFQLNEAGLRIKVSDHSNPVENSDLQMMRNYIQNLIDSKRESMYRYIRYHQDYPLIYQSKYGDTPINSRFEYKIHKI